MLLLSKLSERFGELAIPTIYRGIEYLRWKHITISINRSNSHFEGSIDLDQCEGFECESKWVQGSQIGTRKHTLKLAAQTDKKNNIVCPIKLLLIHALQTAAVTETT